MSLPDSAPLYHRIHEDLVNRIRSGEVRPGDAVETELELAARYDVSRATVRQAMGQLVREGYLEIRRGRGTFVAEPKIEQGLLRFYSFSREIERLGRTPGVRVMEATEVPADDYTAKRLGIPTRAGVVKIARVRLADDEPLIVETSYLPAARFPGLAERDLGARRLYDVLLDDYGIRPASAREELEPVLLDPADARSLGKRAGDPALLLERTTYDTDGVGVEFCRSVVRGDRCRYFVELRDI